MIIDVHGHLGPWFYSQHTGTVADNLRLMDVYGIDLQLVSGVEAVTYDPVRGNASLAGDIADQPRLRGLFVVDPRDVHAAEKGLEQLLPTGLFVGAKIHTHYSATAAGAPAMADALRLCSSVGLPVLVHTWGPQILDLASTVAGVEGARVIAAHLGGPAWRCVPEAVARTDRLCEVPSNSVTEAGRLRWVLDRVDPRLMLFGTDSTLVDPGVTLGALRAARLSQAEQRLIFSENALRLFDLGRVDLAGTERADVDGADGSRPNRPGE